jgi:Spy/CpxP family protein refolding chaperone
VTGAARNAAEVTQLALESSPMKQVAFFLSLAVALAACDRDVTAPVDAAALLEAGGILAWDAAGMSGPGRYLSALGRLPENLRLSATQAAAIKAAVDEFLQATQADRETLAAIDKAAAAAKRAGKSREEIRQILEQGAAARQRMEAAEQALQARIEAILTAEQKAWLDANLPKRCDPRTAPPLTADQKTQISALVAGYEISNRADLDAVKAALEKARAAQKSGATRTEVKAILDAVRPAMARLAAAQAALQQAIDALLTPEQRASGCYRGTAAVVKTGGR